MKKLLLALAALSMCLCTMNSFGEGVDEYTVLMLHFNGEDGSTDVVDSSLSHHTLTANGDVQIDTAEKRLGSGSGQFDGDGDYLSIPDHADWEFGSGDFTIDAWVKFAELSGYPTIIAQGTDGTKVIRFLWQHEINAWRFGINYDGDIFIFDAPDTISVNTWYHVAIVRSGNNWYIFRDGILKGTTTNSVVVPNYIGPLSVGAEDYVEGVGHYFNRWIDELRVSKGIARWTSNFNPPTEEYAEFPNDLPLAHAGADAEAFVGEEVTLDGSYSYDPDGEIISWIWRSLSDPQKPIVAEGEIAAINAHGYAEELIELTVTDNHGATGTDTMKITNPGTEGPPGPEGPPGITPEEIANIQNQITTLQQQNTQQQKIIEENRYLLEQLPQLKKELEKLNQ